MGNTFCAKIEDKDDNQNDGGSMKPSQMAMPMNDMKDYRLLVKSAIKTRRPSKNSINRNSNSGSNGISSFVEGSSHITYNDSQITTKSSYVSFGNSGQKQRRSKYERGNRGALKRSQDQSFMSQFSSNTRGSGQKKSVKFNGREISPVTNNNKNSAGSNNVIDEESDDEAIGYDKFVSRRF